MSETPTFVGQVYTDTNTKNIWRANSTTPGDWSLDVQNPLMTWEPKTINLLSKLPFVAAVLNLESSMDGITSVSLLHTSMPYISIQQALTVISISSTTLTTILDGHPDLGYGIIIDGCTSLTSLDFPLLQFCENPIYFNSTPFVSVAFPSLVTIPNSFEWASFIINGCGNLTTLSIPNFVPINDSEFSVNASPLSDATVNHILARHVANPAYVTGSISLSGDAPTGQGIIDKATLIGRGVSVTTS